MAESIIVIDTALKVYYIGTEAHSLYSFSLGIKQIVLYSKFLPVIFAKSNKDNTTYKTLCEFIVTIFFVIVAYKSEILEYA